MDKCWASPVGNCSGKLTKEHLISKSVLGSGITMFGLPWCNDKPVWVGASSLTGNILCKTHNNDLSKYDDAGKTFFDAVNRIDEDLKLWVKLPVTKIKHPVIFDVDYYSLERWFLKTMINLMIAKGYKELNVGSLLLHLFKDKPFKKPFGLYTYTFNNERMEGNTLLEMGFNIRKTGNKGRIHSVIITYKRFKFLFVLSKQLHGIASLEEIQDRWHNPEVIRCQVPYLKTPSGIVRNLITHEIHFHNR